MVLPDPAEAVAQFVVGTSETELGGQNLTGVVPPGYARNLGQTYPLVLVVGLDGDEWTKPLSGLLQETDVKPVLAFSVGSNQGAGWEQAELKALLEEKVVPWIRAHYRASPLPVDLLLVGWGASARYVPAVVAARPDFWTKSWVPLAEQTRGSDAWTAMAPAYFRSQFGVVAP